MSEHLEAEITRLAALVAEAAELIQPCPVPYVAAGYDSCDHGSWPCTATVLAWRLRGLDSDHERARLVRHARSAMAYHAGEWL